jgi:RNA polymerase sigma factor (sigma-70 family)
MEIEPSKIAIVLNALTYQSLLLGLKGAGNLPFTPNELKTEFHRRVKSRLFQHCRLFCYKNRLDDFTVKETFQKTIIKGIENINSFEFDSHWTDEKFGNKIASWLNRIAFNLFMDVFKERSKMEALDENYYEMEDDGLRPDDFEIDSNDLMQIKLQDALDSLNERERLIVNLCIEHNCLENKDHLPDDIISDICKSLNIKKGNIRVIKFRALKKMLEILKQN